MISNHLFVVLSLLSLINSSIGQEVTEYDYVMIRLINYTVPENSAGSCDGRDIIIKTYCGSADTEEEQGDDDSCTGTFYDGTSIFGLIYDGEYRYTNSECYVDDTFYFGIYYDNPCGANFEAAITETCGDDVKLRDSSTFTIDDYECGWNGPLTWSSSQYKITYQIYKPCNSYSPTSAPTPNTTPKIFRICTDELESAGTSGADTIQVRLWTDDDNYQPSEWRYLNDTTNALATNGSCAWFDTFSDINAQWYLMDFSTCSNDGLFITQLFYWNKEQDESGGAPYWPIVSFSGDGKCIWNSGDYVVLDSLIYNSHTGAKSTDCQRFQIDLGYLEAGDISDQSEISTLTGDACSSS